MGNDAEAALFFLLDPDRMYEVRCPDCDEDVSIYDGTVYPGGNPNIGTELGRKATLGDLVDAARAHECDPALV